MLLKIAETLTAANLAGPPSGRSKTTTAGILAPGAGLAVATALAAATSFAAPPAARPARQNLTFHVVARVSYAAAKTDPAQEQMIDGKVAVAQHHVRIDTRYGGQRMVVLYSPPYVYRLLPESKVGTRYPAGAATAVAGLPTDQDVQSLLSNPAAIRALLKQKGAKLTGTAQFTGVPVDVYTGAKGTTHRIKALLRRGDALPLHLEMTAQRLTVVATWNNYRRDQALPASFFAVPAGYSVRDAAGRGGP